jgi:membrane protein
VGAVIATVVWAVVSLAFSFYTSDLSSYSKTYGAFAGVAILIFWLYLTGLAILVGGEVNAALERLEKVSVPRVDHRPEQVA